MTCLTFRYPPSVRLSHSMAKNKAVVIDEETPDTIPVTVRKAPIHRQVRPIYRAVVQPLLILYIGQTLAKLAPVGKTVSSSHDRQYSSILPSVPPSYHPSASCHVPVVSPVRRCCHVSSAAIAVAIPTRHLPPGIVPTPPGNM